LKHGRLDETGVVYAPQLDSERVYESAPGIVQVIGKPIESGEQVSLQGELEGTEITVQVPVTANRLTESHFEGAS